MGWIEPLLYLIAGYLGFGVLMGGFWLIAIAPKSDPALRGSGWSVRLLLLPGAVAVWPIALWKWSRPESHP